MANPPLGNILIVEDDGELLQILHFVLEDAGYTVAGVSSSKDAIELINTEEIDLVVLDVNLKEASGLDVAKHLRSETKWAHVLIALHTGQNEAETRQQFTDYDLYVQKVDDANVLVAKIAGAMAARGSSSSLKTLDPPL